MLQVLRKLEASLTAGQFYEAHEMFKTVYYRHRARGQAEQSYELAAVSCRMFRCASRPACLAVFSSMSADSHSGGRCRG